MTLPLAVHHLLLINLLCLLAYHAACLEVRGQFYQVDHLPPFHWFRAQTPVARLARQALYWLSHLTHLF